VLTEVSENVLMILFPLKPRELFETYFVRLIGTPNQQFQIKIQDDRAIGCPVVHESLGSELFSESLILAQNERWRRG
jgi:hypothetical protein